MHLDGHILTPEGWVDGRIRFADRIAAIVGRPLPADAPYIVPGFIDLHVPGGGGADALAGEAAIRTIARTHAQYGTTAFLPSPVTAPVPALVEALSGVATVQNERRGGEARVLGAHLEGPFLNPERLGAQPPHARPPDPATVEQLCGAGPVALMTLAPELPGAFDVIRALTARGVAVQLGHSAATYEQTVAALEAGARGFTHLFNAMSPLHHRAPGMVGAALANAEYAALIPDLVHVHGGAIKAALRAIPRAFCVTDAVAAAGMPDGRYALGSHTIEKRGDAAYLPDGTLAGSVLTMDRALRNLVSLGLDLADAARRVATFPADFLGLDDRGRITVAAWADLVVLDRDLAVCRVVIEGEALLPAVATSP